MNVETLLNMKTPCRIAAAFILTLPFFAAGCNNLEANPRIPHRESMTSGHGWVRIECSGEHCDMDRLLAKAPNDRDQVTLVIDGKWILARRGKMVGTPAVRDITSSFTPNGIKSLVVRADGDMTFEPSPDGKVTVIASVALGDARLSDTERKRLIAGFRMTSVNNDGIFHRAVEPPPDFPKDIGYVVNCRVTVPEGAHLGLEGQTDNGALSARSVAVNGAVRLHSGYGHIDAVNAGIQVDARTGHGYVSVKSDRIMRRVLARSDKGSIGVEAAAQKIDAASENGDISIQAGAGSREIEAVSKYGHVTVRGGDEPADSIAAGTGNGTVDFAGVLPVELSCHAYTGRVFATLTRADTAAKSVNLTVNHGNIALKMPPDASVSINAQTLRGYIDAPNIDGHKSSAHGGALFFKASLNGGRTPMDVETYYGDISIQAH